MSAHRIRIFTGTTVRRRGVLRMMVASGKRLGLDCEAVTGFHYVPCDVAVIWGLPKKLSGHRLATQQRHALRHEILTLHAGAIVTLEAPILGRRVRPLVSRKGLLHRLFPAAAALLLRLNPNHRSIVDPFAHYRVGLGGFPDEGGLALAPHIGGRWRVMVERLNLADMSPYRRDGRHILVVGQVPDDVSLRGADINEWLVATCATLRRMTERPVVARLHPLAKEGKIRGVAQRLAEIGVVLDDIERPMAASLAEAWSVVTLSSGAAADALMAGVPAIAMSPASFAWEVTDHDLAHALKPTLFERRPWLEKLAAAHWFEDEIAEGTLWPPLLKALTAGRAVSPVDAVAA